MPVQFASFAPRVAAGLMMTAAAVLAGCGSDAPTTIPVSGTVTYNGEPVTVGKVMFRPITVAEGLPKRPAMGKLQSDGSYRLSTFARNDGAVPGEYHVVIDAMVSGPTPENPELPTVWAVPEAYTNARNTPLKATVPADTSGTLEMDFPLSD